MIGFVDYQAREARRKDMLKKSLQLQRVQAGQSSRQETPGIVRTLAVYFTSRLRTQFRRAGRPLSAAKPVSTSMETAVCTTC